MAGGHGKTVAGGLSVREETLRRVLHTTSADLQALEHLGLHGSTPAACNPSRLLRLRRWRRSAPRPGRTWARSGPAAWPTMCSSRVATASTLAIRLPGLEVGTVGVGTGLPHARAYLSLLGCTGEGSAYSLAQIVAAAVLCLELSASAAASGRGSENFALAHLQEGGCNQPGAPRAAVFSRTQPSLGLRLTVPRRSGVGRGCV